MIPFDLENEMKEGGGRYDLGGVAFRCRVEVEDGMIRGENGQSG